MKYLLSVAFILSLFAPAITYAENCPLPTDAAYRAPGNSAVWYVTDACKKKAFKNSELYFSYFDSFSSVQTSATINQIPTDDISWMAWGPKYDPKYGAVVKTLHDSKVYFLLGGKKYWVDNEQSFSSLGYKWNWVEDVDQRVLNKYQDGGVVDKDTGYPLYTLLKYEDAPEIYRLEPYPSDHRRLVRRHIASQQVFNNLGYRLDRVIEINKEDEIGTNVNLGLFGETISRAPRNLRNSLLGTPIHSSSDVYTPRNFVEPLPLAGHTPEYTLYREPAVGFNFELPTSWKYITHTLSDDALHISASPRLVNFEDGMINFLVTQYDSVFTQQDINELIPLFDKGVSELGDISDDDFFHWKDVPGNNNLNTFFKRVHQKLGVSSLSQATEAQQKEMATWAGMALINGVDWKEGDITVEPLLGPNNDPILKVKIGWLGWDVEESYSSGQENVTYYIVLGKKHKMIVSVLNVNQDMLETIFEHLSLE